MTKNILYPGRPNYTGPTKGLFGFIHHDKLFEYSFDIRERVHFIWNNKPGNEIKHRLHCLVYLPLRRLPKELNTAVKAVIITWEAYKTNSPSDEIWEDYYGARCTYGSVIIKFQLELLTLITKLVPDHTWNDGKLVMP